MPLSNLSAQAVCHIGGNGDSKKKKDENAIQKILIKNLNKLPRNN